jgi:CRISPR system Cascade subunit CasB
MPPGLLPIDTIAEDTGRRIWQIAHGYCRPGDPDPAAAATLATLRRGLGKRPDRAPDLWAFTVPLIGEHPAAEPAVFYALTLFGAHQQSQRRTPMHTSGPSFGRACQRLAIAVANSGGNSEAITRRFVAAGAASTLDAFAAHARSLVGLLRQHRIPLDYQRFVRDAYSWTSPASRSTTIHRWGHDYYRRTTPTAAMADAEDPSTGADAPVKP